MLTFAYSVRLRGWLKLGLMLAPYERVDHAPRLPAARAAGLCHGCGIYPDGVYERPSVQENQPARLSLGSCLCEKVLSWSNTKVSL